MILSNVGIQKAMDAGYIVIDRVQAQNGGKKKRVIAHTKRPPLIYASVTN